MSKYSSQEIINGVSILSVVSSFFILLVYFESFSWTKIMILIVIMALFMYILVKNHFKKVNRYSNKYGRIITQSRKDLKKDSMSHKFKQFFDGLSDNFQTDFNAPFLGNRLNTGLSYSSQIIADSQNYKGSLQEYTSAKYFQREISQFQPRSNQIDIFMPQNITLILNEIKNKIKPNIFLRTFQQMIEKMYRHKNQKYQSSTDDFDQFAVYESISLTDNNDISFVQAYQITVHNPISCAEQIGEFIESRLQQMLKVTYYHFKTVSETVMKCFGLKVCFDKTQTIYGQGNREVSVSQLKEFLIIFRTQNFFTQKFKPVISIKDFAKNHLQKLVVSTNIVSQFLKSIEDNNLMAFKLYLDIFKNLFENEAIQLSRYNSGYTVEVRKPRHAFYVHGQTKNSMFYTYNRIKNFKTTNPLVAIMALMADNFKSRFNDDVRIVRDVNRFFRQKLRVL